MMRVVYKNYRIQAPCAECNGTITTFEPSLGGREFGSVIINQYHQYDLDSFNRIAYILMRCAGCGKGAIAKIHCNNQVSEGVMESFYPPAVSYEKIPLNIPEGIAKEFRGAEECASFGLWRAASVLFRSSLEKALKANGYTRGTLESKIDEAANDGVITESCRKRAHEDIRVLGNDVLHDEWRVITEQEVEMAHRYTQRVLEDLYDDRGSVEAILIQKNRLAEKPAEKITADSVPFPKVPG